MEGVCDHEREQLAAAAKRLFLAGLQRSDGGNLSIRLSGDAMLIKASGASFYQLAPSDLCVCDLSGQPATSPSKPSRESGLHGALYQAFPEVGAIVHCHAPWAISFTTTVPILPGTAYHLASTVPSLSEATYSDPSDAPILPAATYHAAHKLGGPIPVLETGAYAVGPECFPGIVEALKGGPLRWAPPAGLLLKRHGILALGADLDQAVARAELLEETAMIACLAALLGKS